MMKRIALVCMLALLFFSLTLPVYADVPGELPPDSLTIDDATKEKFQLQPGETLFRIYSMTTSDAFRKNDNITDIVADEYTGVIYMICGEDGSYRAYTDSGDPATQLGEQLERDMPYFLAADAIDLVASDIVVYNTYYLFGTWMYDGVAVYYVTDKGDFVYYCSTGCGTGECLFPVDALCELQQDAFALAQILPPFTDSIYLNEVWDLSVFDIHSESFDIDASYPRPARILLALLIVKYALITICIAGSVCLVVAVIKRKKTEKIDQLLA